MADVSQHCSKKRPSVVPVRPPVPYGRRHNSVVVPHYGRDPEEVEVDSSSDVEDEDHISNASHLQSKACGRISQFWMNLASGMKFCSCLPPSPGRKLRLDIKTLRYGYLSHADNENSWEAVSIYRLAREDRSQGEERSRRTSESNRLTYWSNSLTHEGSSSFRHSDTTGVMDFVDEDSKDVVDSRGTELSLLLDCSGTNAVWDKFSQAVDTKLLCESPVFKYINGDGGGKQDVCDNSWSLKVENPTRSDASLAPSLLPPPLPKLPSDSWLSLALSSENQHPQSLLGVHFLPRRPSFRETNIKLSKMDYHLVKFTEVTM